MKVAQSCPTLCNPMDYTSPCNSPGQNTGVGSLSLLQGIFPTQGLNPGLSLCKQILYQLSHKGILFILSQTSDSTFLYFKKMAEVRRPGRTFVSRRHRRVLPRMTWFPCSLIVIHFKYYLVSRQGFGSGERLVGFGLLLEPHL